MKKTACTAIIMASMIFCACKKTETTSTTVPVTPLNLATVFASMRVNPVANSINATTGGSFTTGNGVRYVFPANALQTAAGDPVTGTVQITTTEYVKPSDMIFSAMAPVSNGLPLLSGGEFSISATQGTNTVYLKRGSVCRVSLPQPKTPPPGMRLFYGRTAFKPTAGFGSAVNWQIASIDSSGTGGTIVYNGDTITMDIDSLQLCNADCFMSSPYYQNFTVTLNAGGTTIYDSLVQAYAIYDQYRGYWPMGVWSGGAHNGVISESHVPNIPVHFVIVTVINNELYAGILGVTPANGTNYTVPMIKTTAESLKARIDAL